MFATRSTAFPIRVAAFTLLLTGMIAVRSGAQSAATYSGEQWRPAGVTRPTHVPARDPRSAKPSWQLPNQTSPAVESTKEEPNPLRPKAATEANKAPAAAPREPRAFQPPVHATKMAAANSLAPAKTAVAATANIRPANVPPRPAPQRPAFQQPLYGNQMRQTPSDSPTESLWKTITVAFQGESAPAPKAATETLPMPSDARIQMEEPVMRHFDGPGAFIGPYSPYGESGECCDGSCPCGDGCGDGCCDPCGCGCACGDPGCGCEPGCCCDNCRQDLFCIGPGDDESCHTVRLRWPKWQEVVVFGGVQGFKGPYDQDRDSGNFGFNEGFNIGAKIPYAQLGYQFGWRGTQNQLNGDKDTGIEEQHFQQFATAGIFHRQCTGVNFGVVWDMLNDERWGSRRFHQVRSEISLVNDGRHEIGFTGIFGGSSQDVNNVSYAASDQYLLFYRLHGCNGGEGRLYAGFNDTSDGIIGSDMLIPVGDRFSVSAGFAYLIPDAQDGAEGAAQEAWNIGLGLVWHWDRQARKSFDNCYRPLFNVADNGTLIVND